jgi:Kef-type K+ transport system membrane component KefB
MSVFIERWVKKVVNDVREIWPMFDNGLFLLQIAVIVGFSHLVAAVFRKFGQPRVVGEMAAGIALGPTVFGLAAPGAYQAVFPPASLGFLTALSQVGLAIFVFLVGVRIDFAELRRQRGVAILTSNISVVLPLLMGIAAARYLFPRYGNGNQVHFALFIGTAMSVTAFPVLARILMERNLLGTHLGSVAIACAAVDDVTAWILLAGNCRSCQTRSERPSAPDDDRLHRDLYRRDVYSRPGSSCLVEASR